MVLLLGKSGVKGLACIQLCGFSVIRSGILNSVATDVVQTFLTDITSPVGDGAVMVVAQRTSMVHLDPS
jgi:hypothetical protein